MKKLGFHFCLYLFISLLFIQTMAEVSPTFVMPEVNLAKPEILIVIYMAARNDLSPFAKRNIKHIQNIGSDDRVKIFIRYDMQKMGSSPITKHFFIEKNKLMQLGDDLSMSSGDESSFIETFQTAYERFPADNVVIVLWNHGSGGIEPKIDKAVSASEFFRFNHRSGLLELNRSIPFLEYVSNGETMEEEKKGICFDDAYGSYLTIERLTYALRVITTDILKKKINILACDACFMAAADVFVGFEPYINYYVASQEAAPGTGYRYDILLEPLRQKTCASGADFARHFVSAYKQAYGEITADYTQAAIDLAQASLVEKAIDELAVLLIEGLEKQKEKTVKEALRMSRNKKYCTRFLEPSYIDIGHFCQNLLTNLFICELEDSAATLKFRENLSNSLKAVIKSIDTAVIANLVGKNLSHATGVSLYFPEYVIHKSYNQNYFATKTHWLAFLKKYLATR